MAGKGRPPTPTAILKVRGSWRAKLREGEVEYDLSRPACPSWLEKDARAEWRRVVVLLEKAGVLAVADGALLAAYCQAYGEMASVSREIAAYQKAHPDEGMKSVWHLINIRAAAAARLHRYACEFGFSPASRTRVKSDAAKRAGAKGDELDEFLTRRKGG